LEKKGLHERIVKIRGAAKDSFAIGEFELITERISDGVAVANITRHSTPGNQKASMESPSEGRVPLRLDICRNCNCYITSGETTCPHCKASVQAAAIKYAEETQRRASIIAAAEHLLAKYVGKETFS
jgi:hypothetical protein